MNKQEQKKMATGLLSVASSNSSPMIKRRYSHYREMGLDDDFLCDHLYSSKRWLLGCLQSQCAEEESFESNLLIAVIGQVIDDLIRGRNADKADAVHFFESKRLDFFLDLLGVDAEWFRSLVTLLLHKAKESLGDKGTVEWSC